MRAASRSGCAARPPPPRYCQPQKLRRGASPLLRQPSHRRPRRAPQYDCQDGICKTCEAQCGMGRVKICQAKAPGKDVTIKYNIRG